MRNQDLQKKRWWILIASCFVTLCIGSLYSWSAFASPMSTHLSQCVGYEIKSLAIVFTIANAVGPITMISGGFINDRIGPKGILLVGGVLFGTGMICSGFARSIGVLIVTYGLGVGLGVGMVYGVTVSNTVKFFPDKGGLAGGVITACYGASSVIIPPVANALSEAYHVTTAFKIIGVVMMVIICASAFVIKPCPKDNQVAGTAMSRAAAESKEYNFREMLKESDFYIMIVTMMCGAFAGMMVISQASQIAQRMMGMTPAVAAVVVSVIALFNTMGRLVSGVISDRIGETGTMLIVFAISLAANMALFFCGEAAAVQFYCSLAVVGFSFGSVMGIYPGFTARRFGRKNNSVNYGIMFIGFAVAGIVGPMAINAVYNNTGHYQPAFLIAAVLSGAAWILAMVMNRKCTK